MFRLISVLLLVAMLVLPALPARADNDFENVLAGIIVGIVIAGSFDRDVDNHHYCPPPPPPHRWGPPPPWGSPRRDWDRHDDWNRHGGWDRPRYGWNEPWRRR